MSEPLNTRKEATTSVVLQDPKGETVTHLQGRAEAFGYRPEDVFILAPRLGLVPGWNIFQCGLPAVQAAGDFVTLLLKAFPASAPRMVNLLMHVFVFIATLGLSVFEAVRLLQDDGYREGLLRLAVTTGDSFAFEEARAFLQYEFGNWGKGERMQAVAPALTRLGEIMRSDFLRPLLCAKRTTLDLGSLWERPRMILVHLDHARLGEEGARLLAGMVTNLLVRAAFRASGPVPVLLILDELAKVEQFVGSALIDILTMARSLRLRLLVGSQHFAGLSTELQAAIFGNVAVSCFFRLGPTDARVVGAALAAGSEPRLKRLQATRETTAKSPFARATWRHPICDATGTVLRTDSQTLSDVRATSALGLSCLHELYRLVQEGPQQRLYVKAPDSGEPVEVYEYTRGLHPDDFWLDGPSPLELVVSFPKPKLSGIERFTETDAARAWSAALQDMPVRQMALRVTGEPTGITRVGTVADPVTTNGLTPYLNQAIAHNCQSEAEVEAVLRQRAQAVRQIAAGVGLTDTEEGMCDGSLA